MAGDRTRSQQRTRLNDSPAADEWYVVTGAGASALRISQGLTVGETEAGALALNDPDPGNQWVEFVLTDDGDPWIAIVTREKSLCVNGTIYPRHQVGIGATIQLPHNTLYISHDIHPPRPGVLVLEVVSRDVPGRAQDLVGPGWEEALAAVRSPQSAAPPPEMTEPDDPDRTEIFEPPVPPEPPPRASSQPRPAVQPRPRAGYGDGRDDLAVTVAEPRVARSRRRRRRRGANRAVVLAASLAVVAVTLGGVAAVFLSLSEPEGGSELSGLDLDSVGLDAPATDPLPDADAGLPADSAARPADPAVAANRIAQAAERQVPAAATSVPHVTSARGSPEAGTAARPASDQRIADGAGAPPSADADTSVPASGEAVALIPRTVPQPAASVPEDPAAQPPAAAPEPQTRDPAAPTDWRLVRARELLESGYITFPPQDNAVAYLERLLAIDPFNTEAMAMLEECSARLIDAAVRAHDQGLDYEARNTLEEVLGFDPQNARVDRLWQDWVGTDR